MDVPFSEHFMSDDSSPDLAEIAARRVGQVLVDKWRLERVIGAGGMATVYAATHRNNLRAVAIKMLHPELAGNAEIKKRFLREGYIANKVGHPAAVSVLDDGVTDDGNVFLVMDLLLGQSLHQRHVAARGSLPASEVLRIADGVLDVLIAAHEQGIIHRDLKPDNVFLTTDGAVKVLDFGIARLLEPPSGERVTQTGVMIGTPAYMPPEQARGRSKLVDERSDLWALGAIMYALLTGHHVHEGETPQEVLLRAMTENAPPLVSRIPDASPALCAVVDRALSSEPADRWPDARAMRTAVRAARAGIDPTSTRDGDLAAVGSAQTMAATSSGIVPQLTPVTKASAPIVRDVNGSRARGGKMLAAALLIGVIAFGASLFARAKFRPESERNTILGTTSGASTTDAMAEDDAALVTDASMAATPVDTIDLDGGALDADADIDADDEEDDGGDDEEEEDTADASVHGASNVHKATSPKKHASPKHPKRKHPKKRR